MNDLSPRILQYLRSTPSRWIDVHVGESLPLGLLGEPEPLPVEAGEQVAVTRSYGFSWDIGVIDNRVRGDFAARGPRRYPTFEELEKLLGLDVRRFIPGNQFINATCFLDYFPPDVRAVWSSLLESSPKTCGRTGWDIVGKLRGSWFNPAVDETAVPPVFEVEFAAISISPDADFPDSRVQIGIGSKNRFSALDPTGLYPQLVRGFSVQMDKTPGSRVNPDPAVVDQTTGTVCYDLLGFASETSLGAYNVLFLKMESARRLWVKFDGTSYATPQCSTFASVPEDPGFTVMYER